jgi:hypothetical protein
VKGVGAVTRITLSAIVAGGTVSLAQADVIDSAPSPRDNAVVAAVVRDLLAYKGKDSPLGGFGPEKPVPVDVVPATSSGVDVDGLLCSLDAKTWRTAKVMYRVPLKQALKELARRAPEAEGQFELTLKDVVLQKGRAKPSATSIFNRAIEFMLPGYSDDRQFAVVSFSVPWSIHSVGARYGLVQDGGRWRVVARQFDYYL